MSEAKTFTFLNLLRWVGFLEGCSTLVLFFIAVPLKYWAELPIGVEIVGPIHGFLFVGLVGMLVLAIRWIPISIGLSLGGMFSALVPFGPFVFDRWLARFERS